MPIGGGALVGPSNGGFFTVQADLAGTPFGGVPTWTDITSWVLTDEDPPIAISWGRQDEDSEIQPRTCAMTLDNSDGRFTPGYTGGPYGSAIDVGVRLRVSVTVNGTTYPRFDGYANDWDAGWDNGGPMSICTVDASDITAWMGTLQPLRSIVVEEMLLDAPRSLFPLDEVAGSASAGDLVGTSSAATAKTSKYGAGTLTFGVDTTVFGQSAAMSMSSPDSGSATLAAKATYLSIPNAAIPDAAGWSVEFWFVGPGAPPANVHYLYNLNPSSGASIGPSATFVYINNTGLGGTVHYGLYDTQGSAFIILDGSAVVADGKVHHLVLSLSADAKTLSAYIDGALDATQTVLTPLGWAKPTSNAMLGLWKNGQHVSFPLAGQVSLCAFYPAPLSAARIAAHYQAGLSAFAGERTDTHAARLLGYRPNTGSVLDVGKGTIGVHSTEGSTLTQALLDTGTAEGGPVFADGQGRVALLNRAHLYNPAAGLTLDAGLDQVTAALQFRRDTQDILNDVTHSRPDGAAQRVVNAASTAKYGTRGKTDTIIVNSDRAAADAAGWAVAVGKTVKTKSPQLEVDLLTEPSSTQAAAVLAAGPLTVANITNLPSATSPATSVKTMIQGATETIGINEWHIGFYATPLPPGTLRADAVPSANTKLDNGLVIPW